MNIYFALCGNSYSEALSRSFMAELGVALVHRSNARTRVEKIYRFIQLIFVVALRYLFLPINGSKLVLLIPHTAGSYGRLSRILRPHQYILIDDGATFEYWSKFHDRYISSLYTSSKTTLLLGPRQPNWGDKSQKTLALHLIGRQKITEGILGCYTVSAGDEKMEVANGSIGWLVDDGELTQWELEQLKAMIRSEFECDNVRTLWHPTRGNKKDTHRPAQPAEVSILFSGLRPAVVVGKASTTLFNIAAYDSTIKVATLPSGYNDLDQAALEQGITVIDIRNHAKN